MIYKIGNNYARIGGKCLSGGKVILGFETKGAGFPLSYPYSSTHPSYRTGRMIIDSSTPNKITVSYGDGTTVVQDFGPHSDYYRVRIADINAPDNGGTLIPYHEYTDGNTDSRIVSMSFQRAETVYMIETHVMDLYGVFPANIDKLTSLKTLALNHTREISAFPVSIANSKIKTLRLVNIGSALNSGIPLEFLNIPLQDFRISGSVDFSDAEISNFSKINRMKETLTTLHIAYTKITTLPITFTELYKLSFLDISTNNYLEPPSEINSLTALLTLVAGGGYGFNNTITGWGDLSSLTEMRHLSMILAQYLDTNVPAYLVNMPLMYRLSVYGSYKTVERSDAFTNSMYDLVVANAPIVGTASDVLRGITVDGSNGAYENAKPSGTYQQPAGYEQGVSNGTPASPMEKIWVMVNQYGHAWTLPA
jgi:hypothetical protein